MWWNGEPSPCTSTPHDGFFARVSDTTCTLELSAPTLDVLAARILWLGVDFEVVTPDTLGRHLHELAARLERASTRRLMEGDAV